MAGTVVAVTCLNPEGFVRCQRQYGHASTVCYVRGVALSLFTRL